jgi:predicted ThiF/HesA family dinucleotide-utilizing enzyme
MAKRKLISCLKVSSSGVMGVRSPKIKFVSIKTVKKHIADLYSNHGQQRNHLKNRKRWLVSGRR